MKKNTRTSVPIRAANRVTKESLIAAGIPLDLIVLSCKWQALPCRPPGTTHEVTFKTTREGIPGSIMTVVPTRVWTDSRRLCLAGDLRSTRFDVASLGLRPFAVRRAGDWDPAHEYWAEDGEPIDEWAKPVTVASKRSGQRVTFSWRLWNIPATLRTVRSLVWEGVGCPKEQRPRGPFAAFGADRVSGAKGKLSFAPTQGIW